MAQKRGMLRVRHGHCICSKTQPVTIHYSLLTVFCSAMGKSRSATLVVSCKQDLGQESRCTVLISRFEDILNKSPSTTPEQALDIIRESRPIVEPNPGFMDQLRLYHSMGCPQDVTVEPAYQRWLYQREVEMSVACGRAPDTIRFEDEASPGSDPSPQTPHASVELRCRRCRRSLAKSPYILAHTPKAPSATQAAQAGPISTLDNDMVDTAAAPPCAHVFLDPLSWMRPELEQGKLEGKLNCPKCSSNVGKYAWQGMRCSCGTWVTPAVSLAKGRIDEVKARARPAAGNQNGKI